jgi:hypothetical protein
LGRYEDNGEKTEILFPERGGDEEILSVEIRLKTCIVPLSEDTASLVSSLENAKLYILA